MKLALSALFSASLMAAATLPGSSIKGEYVEARTADVYTGPCFASGEVELVGDLAVMGWKVTEGSFDGVKLDGLSVVGVVKASATLGDTHHSAYPVKSVLIVDETASPEQRLALKRMAQRLSNDLLSDVVRIDYKPISLTFANNSIHSVKATLKAGNLAAIQTRPIDETDSHCTNEIVWYDPLTKIDHAMPGVALAHSFSGQGLGTTWSSPDKRSAFVGSFHYND
jgi:hypothetical protein